MSRGILDTSVLVADGITPISGELAISVVSIAELHLGVLVATNEHARATRLTRLSAVQRRFDPLPVDDAVTDSYAAAPVRCDRMYTWYTRAMDRTASIREVRDSLADAVDRATHDEPTIITRRGREVAAVVPIETLREWRAWEEERVVRLVAERSGELTYPLEQVMAEVLGE